MTKFSIFTYGLVLLLPACNSAGSAAPGGSGGTPAVGGGHASGGFAGLASSSGGSSGGIGGTASSSAGQSSAGTSSGMGGSTSTGGSGSGSGGTSVGGSAGSVSAGGAAGSSSTAVTVQRATKLQPIDGFGLNTALSSPSVNWDTFYGTGTNGLGLSIVRVAMDSNGKLNGVMPPASAKAKVIASPWTAAGSCKDNGTTTKGGHLLKSCYDSWSTKIADFAKAQGLYAIAASNEPDFASCGSTIGPPCNGDYDSMVFTASEMVEWVKVLGPKIKALNPPVKFIAPEPSEWIHLWSNMSATGSTVTAHPNSSDPFKCGCFGNTPGTTGCASTCEQGNGYDYGHWLAKDATAWGLIDIIGTHEYDTQKAEAWPADVDGGKRSKPIWETEVSGVMYWPEQGASTDIKNGIAVAGWIHSALTVGEASAWLYWWYEASGDNEGLLIKGSSALTKRCYTLGNYSKFVRPGYTRVDITGAVPSDILLSAYTGEDGTVVIVAINKGSAAVSVPITIAGGTAVPATLTPNVTSANDNLTAKPGVTVTGGTFTAALDGMTVTTFVGK
ncbi:MAG TPA: glycoside hydrolase family 30 beta sandwich domain-containing protein [Polyangiaceae bacterium]|nr:glycoside hydrolase family 30 beta sandwich domain-containing protein [Polyangiaceae bacterium]